VSACNIFTQGDAAYILTDGAFYDADGVIEAIESKFISSNRLRLAIASTGARCIDHWPETLKKIPTQEEFFQHLAELAERARDQWQQVVGSEQIVSFQLFVAAHSKRTNAPTLAIYATHQGPASSYRQGLHRVVTHQAPQLPAPFPTADDLLDPGRFNVNRDSVPLLEAQRTVRWPDGALGVGGFVELTRLDRTGVKRRILHRWPDQVGHKIAAHD
jgi:hypothetical protein